ncbi:V-set and immunoglobulin domain-containing protein 2 [Varanus komodoensis]|uniref:V-set and immunoglobulin domain-containing protein 2 n=1 Tax=Varanus komodoensis TaxID=61221 RepID=UPI001CF7C5F2|nr:V-set and immunoglobulin domain-containing protein 2 [Varanus komodoensis]
MTGKMKAPAPPHLTLTSATQLPRHPLTGLGACVDVTVPHGQVMQKKGLNVTLPCNYQTSVDKAFMLEWKFSPGSTSPDGGKQILYFTSNTLYKPGAQAKRLHLLQDPPTLGIATIQLTDLRSSDAGIYTCEVNNPPDFYGTSFGQIELIVLMAPSSPVCRGTTSVSVGSNTTLTCNSTEGVPAPIYSWKRLDSKSPLPVSNTVQNEKTGTLELLNVSLALAGIYQCTSSNEFGQKTCQITLQVTAMAQAGVIAGAVIGVLLALLLLVGIAFYVLHRRKQKRNKKAQSIYSANEIREDATAPGISETSLQKKDSKSELHLLESESSRPGSASTTKSQLKHLFI